MRGNSLFPKVWGDLKFFSGLSFQCQHQTSESGVSLGMMLLVRRSSLGSDRAARRRALPLRGAHPEVILEDRPLAWRTGFGLKARERQEDLHLRRPPLDCKVTDDSFCGEWLPTKEDPEKEKSMRTRAGEGRGGTSSRRAKWRWRCPRVSFETKCVAGWPPCSGRNTAGP